MSDVPRYYLCLHGLGSSAREYEPDEERYWIQPSQFDALVELHAKLREKVELVFTFDDANSSDYDVAAKRLERAGIRASFFVLADKIGLKSYMDRSQVVDLAKAGHLVGSHGCGHLDWRRVDGPTLHTETQDSRKRLQDMLGMPVDEVGIPFGSYDGRVLRGVKDAGYARYYSCDGGPRLHVGLPFQSRLAIERTHTPEYLERRIMRDLTLASRLVQEGRIFVKAMR